MFTYATDLHSIYTTHALGHIINRSAAKKSLISTSRHGPAIPRMTSCGHSSLCLALNYETDFIRQLFWHNTGDTTSSSLWWSVGERDVKFRQAAGLIIALHVMMTSFWTLWGRSWISIFVHDYLFLIDAIVCNYQVKQNQISLLIKGPFSQCRLLLRIFSCFLFSINDND